MDAEALLDLLQIRGFLNAAQARDGRIEKVEKDGGRILVEMEEAVGMRGTGMQHVEEAAEALEELEPPKVMNLQGRFGRPTGFTTLDGFSVLGHARRLSQGQGRNQVPRACNNFRAEQY